jgi:hypothetical protein
VRMVDEGVDEAEGLDAEAEHVGGGEELGGF